MFSKFFLCILLLQIGYYILSIALQYFKTNFLQMLCGISFYVIGICSLVLNIKIFPLIALAPFLLIAYRVRKEQGYLYLNCLKACIFSLLAYFASFAYIELFYFISVIAWFYIAQTINGILLKYFIEDYFGENK